jgi:two-component system, NarL family, response regulator YdfI
VSTNGQPGVFIVAASAARRAGLQKLLCAFMPEGSIHTGAAFSTVPIQQSGAEVLLDNLGSSAEASAMLRILSNAPSVTASVALIDDPDPLWVRRALAAGVNAIISREATGDDLHLAVDAADAGFVLLHPSSARVLIAPAGFALKHENLYQVVEDLTAREREVLNLMSAGLGNKEIALRLEISEHTVKFHASSILGKLGASSRTEAVSQGIRLGLISL